jgi:hypothetical protein
MNDPNTWNEAQQQLWRFWRALFESASGGTPGAASTDGLSAFWRQFGLEPGNPGGPTEAFTRLFNPWLMGSPGAAGPEAFGRWLNQSLQDLLRNTARPSENHNAPFEAMNEFFCSPLRLWQSAFANSAGPFDTAGFSPMAPSQLAALADLPPLGLTREWETAWREVQRAYAEQVDAGGALGRQIGAIYHTALQRFIKATSHNDSADGEITSLRELYDLWVSIAEQAYAEKVMTTEYSQAFGRFINASARSSKARQELANDVQETMNLPNRRELDSIIRAQHALQAEVRSLGTRTVNHVDIDVLTSRVEVLSRKLDELAAAPKKKSQAATKPKKAKAESAPTRKATSAAKRRRPATGRRAKPASSASRTGGEFDIGSFVPSD